MNPITPGMIIRTRKDNRQYFKTGVIGFGFFIYLCVIVFSCEQEQKLTAQNIVARSIEAHGGLDLWKEAKSLSFDKSTILFKRNGSIEKEIKQRQEFQLQPKLTGTFHDLKLIGNQGFHYDGETYWKMANDSVWEVSDSLEMSNLKNTLMAAHYVVCQPFKLLDANAILNYKGVEEMDDKRVHAIEVSYKGDLENSDQWIFYFEVESFKLIANKVKHNTNISLIKNLSFDKSSGMMFNAHRKSYTLTEEGTIDYLRAEYLYENFEVEYVTQ